MADDYVTRKDLAELVETLTARVEGIFKESQRTFEGMFRESQGTFENMFREFQRNMVEHMDENFATKQELAAAEERLIEKIHDTETRVLRGYESHARSLEAHLKTLDGQSAANFLAQAGLSERMSA